MERILRIDDRFEAILGQPAADRDGQGTEPNERTEAESPFCLGLFGEFNVGKSSLANLLASLDMLPTSILSSTRIPTRLKYHPTDTKLTACRDNGERRSLSVEEANALDEDDVAVIEIRLPNRLLRCLEILDTPGFSDPYHDPERTIAAAAEVQIGLWCTLATQAWRYSEQRIWTSLPEHLHQTGILVVTHGDVLPTQEDRNKVMARLKRATKGLFYRIIMISIPHALKALAADGAVLDQDLWRRSGGGALQRALQASLARAVALTRPRPVPEAQDRPRASSPEPPQDAGERSKGGLQRLDICLSSALTSIKGCHLAALIDVATRRSLGSHIGETGSSSVDLGQIAGFAADLFRGPHMLALEQAYQLNRMLGYFEEIVIRADDVIFLLLRSKRRQQHAVLFIIDASTNMGLAMVKARMAMREIDDLEQST